MTTPSRVIPATVYLVGAGPGDPGLVTLRAVECLARADLVLYDYLVDPAALRHASSSAELICLGHHSTGRTLDPDEIVARMLEAAREGKTVVRLKGGDPSVFGRGADEIEALRQAGIPFEIVPGITAGLAVGAYCEIPITHHDDASAVALIAGQERHTKATSCLDYGVLADFPGTLVFYMGVRKAAQWSQALIAHGKPPDTPVAIVRWCTRPRQQTIRCTLRNVAETVDRHGLRPPAIFVIGKVVDRAPPLSWFAARPMFGTCVLVPLSPETPKDIPRRLAGLGADVITQPVVLATEPPDWAPVDTALDRLDQYDWLLFFSPCGVDHLFRRLFDVGGDVRRLGRLKLAALGQNTAERLARYHLQPDLTAEPLPAHPLPQALLQQAEGRRFLLAGANVDQDPLADELRAAGARVEQIAVYRSAQVQDPNPDVSQALSSGRIHWVTVAGPATARSLVRLFGEALHRARLASIGPLTSTALRDLGHPPAAEAPSPAAAELIDAIRRA